MSRAPADFRAAQLLLARGIVASTLQLVRTVRDGRQAPAVRQLMLERRRMLAELAGDKCVALSPEALGALDAAVAESDRTLEALLA